MSAADDVAAGGGGGGAGGRSDVVGLTGGAVIGLAVFDGVALTGVSVVGADGEAGLGGAVGGLVAEAATSWAEAA